MNLFVTTPDSPVQGFGVVLMHWGEEHDGERVDLVRVQFVGADRPEELDKCFPPTNKARPSCHVLLASEVTEWDPSEDGYLTVSQNEYLSPRTEATLTFPHFVTEYDKGYNTFRK